MTTITYCEHCGCNTMRPCTCGEVCMSPLGDLRHPSVLPEQARVLVNGAAKSGTYGVYGYGATLEEAKANFRRNGGGLMRGYTIFEFTNECVYGGVDGMGGVHFFSTTNQRPTKTEVRARGRKVIR